MKKVLVTISLLLMSVSGFAQGQTGFQCTMGELTRRVEIMHETGVSVPCEVHYYKDTEAPGEQQVLWRALHEAGYCEAKTTAFIASLTEMGWDCAANVKPAAIQGMDDVEPEMMDDTDALAPVEEEIELTNPDSEAG